MDPRQHDLTAAQIPESPTPTITLSEAATKALEAAMVDADGDSLRLQIDARFQHELFFGQREPGDIEVRTSGPTIYLDQVSARRANGVTIDFIGAPTSGFKIDNPNQPPKAKPTVKPSSTPIELMRDCEATVIPGGEKVTLAQGDVVVLTQALGGSFTVRTDDGALVRIAAQDADALGLEAAQANEANEPSREAGPFDLQKVMDKLKTVFDPEIPINVVDLGLIYACEAHATAEGGHRVEIKMSMTAPGCGMGDVLKEDARAKVQAAPGVTEVDVEIVWDPPWDKSRMSDAARLELGMF